MPIRAPVVAHDVGDDVGDLVGQHPAVGVAQGDDLGAGLGGDAHGLERVVAVRRRSRRRSARRRGRPAGPPTRRNDTVSRIISRFSASVVRSARSTCPVCDLATRVTTCARLSSRARTCGSLAALPPARRVAPNAASVALRSVSSRGGAGEELGVLGVGAGPAALDEADAQLVEVRRDGELVGHGEVEPLLLRAVAQRRVVDVEVGHRCSPGSVCRSPGVCAPAREGRGDDVWCSRPIVGPALPPRRPGWGRCDPAPRSRRARDAPDKQKTPRVREVCATRRSRRASR